MFTAIKALFSNIGTLIALLEMAPTIENLIQQVEKPGVSGTDKKAALLTLLQDTLNVMTNDLKVKLPVTTIMTWAATIVDTLVTILTQAGVLPQHVASAAVTAPVANAPANVATDTANVGMRMPWNL